MSPWLGFESQHHLVSNDQKENYQSYQCHQSYQMKKDALFDLAAKWMQLVLKVRHSC